MHEKLDSLVCGFLEDPYSYSDWFKAIEAGPPPLQFEKLRHQSYEGFNREPIYHAHGRHVYTPVAQPRIVPPRIGTQCLMSESADFAAAIRDDFKNDVAVCYLDTQEFRPSLIPKTSLTSLKIRTYEEFSTLLSPVFSLQGQLSIRCLKSLSEIKTYTDRFKAEFGQKFILDLKLTTDPLYGLTLNNCSRAEFEALSSIVSESTLGRTNDSNIALEISSSPVHLAGGHIGQELGFILSQCLWWCKTFDISVTKFAERAVFEIPLDSDIFSGISKVRACRTLLAHFLTHLSEKPKLLNPTVKATTSPRNYALIDSINNVLRGCASSCGAFLGGADIVLVEPYTSPGQSTLQSHRLARNNCLVLTEESHLSSTIDPGKGSYYIEELTQSYSKLGWKFFQQIEAQGGLLSAIESGFLKAEIDMIKSARVSDIERRKAKITGVSSFADLAENLDSLKLMDYGEGLDAEDVHLEPWRLAQNFEELRLRFSKNRDRIETFMIRIGEPHDYIARETFTKSFLATSGIETVLGPPGKDPLETISKINTSRLRSAFICSSDRIYESLGPKFIEAIQQNTAIRNVYIAGHPKLVGKYFEAAETNHLKIGYVYQGCNAPQFFEMFFQDYDS